MSQTTTTTSLSASLPLDMTTEDPVPTVGKAIHKFYEPIMLYEALTDAVKHTAKPPAPEPNINIEDPKQVFCAFVNKLSHVCDKEKGGNTVTSFVILKDQGNPARAHFVFAVNRRTDRELGVTAAYVKSLLHKIDQAPDGEVNQHNARSSLLYHILRFNRPRVSFYLRNLRSQTELCLESCKSTNTIEDGLIAEELNKILLCPSTGSDEEDWVNDYLRQSETMIQLLVRMEKTPAGAAIKTRAMEERMPGTSMECWPKLFHTMSRILAYLQSVKFLLRAKREWPSLFQDPAVGFLSSSRLVAKPARQKSQKADEIIGRMTRKTKDMETFKRFVEALQVFDLDARIQAGFRKDTFKPTAHAEVILLNWLLKPGERAPEKFFNEWAYIGSSKATCKLCVHYFREHRSNVEHRPCHGNFYPSWRIPDVFPYQGEEAEQQKQTMVNRVLEQVRKDTFDIVKRKASPSTKEEDSNTFSAGMTLDENWSVRGSQADDYNDIAIRMGGMSLNRG